MALNLSQLLARSYRNGATPMLACNRGTRRCVFT
jgi:hypothetical protein